MEKAYEVVQDTAGNAIIGASVNVYDADTGALATVYEDNEITVKAQPFLSDSKGGITFKAPNGNYRIAATSGGETVNIYRSLFDQEDSPFGLIVLGVTALRGTTPVSDKRYWRAYHTTAGDGGHLMFRGVTGAAPGTYIDNGGTIIVPSGGDGSAAFMGEYSVAVNVKWFGAHPDASETTNATALQAAFNTVTRLYVPGGIYLCNAKLTSSNKDFAIEGDGSNHTEIRFTGATAATAGVSIVLNDSTQFASVKGMSLTSSTAYAESKAALRIDGSNQISGGLIQDRSNRRFFIEDVSCKGSNIGGATGWGDGIRITSLGWGLIDGYTFIGDTTLTYSGFGIRIDGAGTPVEIQLHNLWIYSAETGVFLPDYAEGVFISKFNFVNVIDGIYAAYTAGRSVLAEGSCGILQPVIGPGHISCKRFGVYLSNTNQGSVNRTLIYITGSTEGNVGIVALNGADNIIADNVAINTSTATTKNGIVLNAIDRSIVRGNRASGVQTAVALQNGSDNNHVSENYGTSVNYVIGAEASCSGNYYEKNRGASIAIAEHNIGSTTDIKEPRRYSISTVKTLTGGAVTETVDVAIPSGFFFAKPSFAMLIESAGTQQLMARYEFDSASSTATNARFTIFRNDGGNITAGATRFGMMATE